MTLELGKRTVAMIFVCQAMILHALLKRTKKEWENADRRIVAAMRSITYTTGWTTKEEISLIACGSCGPIEKGIEDALT